MKMTFEHPQGRLAFAVAYTLYTSGKAMGEQLVGGSHACVHNHIHAWCVGMQRHLGIEVRAFGVDAVDWSQTYILMANHSSYLDVMALYAALPKVVGFIAKKELMRVPFLAGTMRAIGCVPVDRGKHRQAVEAIREAAEAVRSGASLAVFPEGTRSRGDRIQPLKKGPFYLAQMAQVPVIPIGIRGASARMPRKNTAIYPGIIEVHAGVPIPPPVPHDHESRGQVLHAVRAELSRLAALPMMG